MQFRLFFSFLFFWKRKYSRRRKTFSISAACFIFLVLFSLSLCGAGLRKSSVTLREEVPWEHRVVANRTWCSVEKERERERERERARERERETRGERERGGGGGKEPCSWVRDSNKLKKNRETKKNNERQNSKMHAMESFPQTCCSGQEAPRWKSVCDRAAKFWAAAAAVAAAQKRNSCSRVTRA